RDDPRLKIFVFEEITEVHQSYPANLLTFLDGEGSVSNSITLATTNYSGSLPANLVERPGRFDVVMRIGDPGAEARRSLLRLWLEREPEDHEVSGTESLSSAAIREVVFQSRIKSTTLKEEVALYRSRVAAAKDDFGTSQSELGFRGRRGTPFD